MASNDRTAIFLDTAPAAALTASASETQDYTVTRACYVMAAQVLATATAGVSGTARLSRQALGTGSFNVITAALAMTTAATITVGTSLVIAEYVCAATDILRVTFVDGGGAGGANGRMTTTLVSLPITGAS